MKPVLQLCCIMMLCGCASVPPTTKDPDRSNVDIERYLPRLGGHRQLMLDTAPAEREHLSRVATDLVSALMQLPEMLPQQTTVQFSPPNSAFGNAILRALEDAGYGIQLVDADLGLRYLRYRHSQVQSESGPVEQFELSMRGVELKRSYRRDEQALSPISPMQIRGSHAASRVVLVDQLFQSSGAEMNFVSGVQTGIGIRPGLHRLREVDAEAPSGMAIAPSAVLEEARRAGLSLATAPATDRHIGIRRTVLILNEAAVAEGIIGVGNKSALALLASSWQAEDVFEITACTDSDGRNPEADRRGERIAAELLAHGVPANALYVAPCRRASYRHPSDRSPVAVEVVQHRLRK